MNEAGFKRGNFHTFRATNKIHLGKYETDIMANDEFDYDGYSVRYAGMAYDVPQLRGLVGDWFVPVADTTSTYHSKPAGVQVSHATPEARDRGDTFQMEEASEEEAVVGTMTEQTAIRKAAANGHTERLAELRAVRQQRKVAIGLAQVDTNREAPPPENYADVDTEVEAALMEHTEQSFIQAIPTHSAQPGGAAPISGSEASKVAQANAVNLARIAATANHLDQVDPRKTREEMGGQRHNEAHSGGRVAGIGGKFQVIDQDDGEVVGKYNFSEGAAVGSGVVEAGQVKAVNVLKSGGNLPVQVGRAVATTPKREKTGAQVINDPAILHEPQAVRAASTTQVSREGNVGIDDIRPGGATGDVDEVMSGDDLASLLPGAAVAGQIARKRPLPPPPQSESDEITEVVAGWSTRRHWQKRVQEAVDFYGDWPEAIDAICEKESPKVSEQIRRLLAGDQG